MQSGPEVFGKSRFIMTFLTTLGVTEILCTFRLGLGGKAGKWILEFSRLEFLEKFLANNFPLSDAEYNNSELLNIEGISRFIPVENTISNSPKVLRAKFLGSNGLFCFSRICKFGSLQSPFATITSLK